ncbi:MAG: hypothetical protein OXQ90_09610 [Gammaproteobacteria bacterium]|nr:hypothetical protein [Gammaproteobacteria bacterium]
MGTAVATIASSIAAPDSGIPASAVPFRVSPEKVVVPDPPVGALHRPDLLDRCDPARRRLTVLLGSGGFGKTTLMADCCRRAIARGDRVIWLSLDEDDDAERLVAHLTYAAEVPWELEGSGGGSLQKAEMRYLDGLLAGIRADGQTCMLALDELDRMPALGARIIDYLIWRGPANLRLMLACRQLPRLIDVATPIAEGRGVVLGPEDLRLGIV